MNALTIQDCLFPSDNALEVPSLRLEMQPEAVGIPFILFGETRRSYQMNGSGTVCFYTDDYRFNTVYEHPEKILAMRPGSVVEPNFSLYDEMPVAFGLQQIYKKRWVARAMQMRGVPVFVDLCCSPKYYKLNLLGVPLGWRSFCTRGYSYQVEHLAMELEIAQMVADGNEVLFVCYGGGAPCKAFCREHGLVYVTPAVEIRNANERYEKMREAIDFFGEKLPAELVNPDVKTLPDMETLKQNSVVDYGGVKKNEELTIKKE